MTETTAPTPFSVEEITTLAKLLRPFEFPTVTEENAKVIEASLQDAFPGGRVELGEQKTEGGEGLGDLIVPLWVFRHEGRRAFIR